jgi:hypothetical protein
MALLPMIHSGSGWRAPSTAPVVFWRRNEEKCREKKIGEWPFVITQVNKTNNAKEAIQQPTAVKISWIRFGKEELQSQAHLNTLIDALMEMRDKETCLVKFEGKQACFKVLVNENKVEELHAVAKQ